MSEPDPECRVVYQGRRIDLALKRIVRSDGSTTERELVLHPGAVALLPMVDQDHVCLVKNERFAVGKTLLEVPAGTIDPGERPIETARRELAEETGYTAGRITLVREWYVSPGVMNERMFLFLCEDLLAGPQALEPDEKIEMVVMEWREAVALALRGAIEDAKTMLALLILDRQRSGP